MRKQIWFIWMLLMLLQLTSCSTTKFVPDGQHLLNKMRVKIDDRDQVNALHRQNASVETADEIAGKMKGYVRQKNNTEVFGFWKLQLQVYSAAGMDTSRWFNRAMHKMGEPPVIFDRSLTNASLTQIRKGMNNKGYFGAQVDTTMFVKGKKLDLTYHIHAGEPVIINNYRVKIDQPELRQIATMRSQVRDGIVFDAEVMDAERERITRAMRRRGFFYFEKDLLMYEADTTYMRNSADVVLKLRDYVTEASEEVQQGLFTRYRIHDVQFVMDKDSVQMLRKAVLQRNCFIRSGDYYDVLNVERTYSALQALGPVKYVDISFQQVSETELDCKVVLSKGKIHSVSVETEGTYSAGDWGITAGAGYTNRNLFRGAEELNLRASGSYEWRQNGGRAIEAKTEASIQFTNAPKVLVGYKYQKRPDEFTRTVANASLSYSIQPYGQHIRHQFNFLDISYVYLPWISDEFKATFLKPTNLLRYSYEDHFIVGWSYSGTYTDQNSRNPLRSYTTLAYQVETAGNLLYGLSRLVQKEPDPVDGAYKIFNIRFAQYAKADFHFTHHSIFSAKHRLVLHSALGVAVPFLNAQAVPFEKRYFAGGAASVRGWLARTLGPGSYRGTLGDRKVDYYNQTGDIKLDLNLEYRWKVWSIIELAAFTDAGNVWTIREYDQQPNGVFRWNQFYKQIAWSWGTGIRLDFSFFIFRVDFGVKLYDPSRIEEGRPWRTAPNGLNWKDDVSVHFAIGHPF